MNLSTVYTCAILAAANFLAAPRSSAADVIFDFESPAEIKAAPKLNRSTYRFGVTNMCASSGKNSFRLSADSWKEGDYQWPAFQLNPKINDWSGYDRLAIDLVNLADDGDMITIEIAGPEDVIKDMENIEVNDFTLLSRNEGYTQDINVKLEEGLIMLTDVVPQLKVGSQE